MSVRPATILLIIEDDEILLRALHLLFHEEKYVISSATDGESGLRLAERLKPNLILLDLLLPKMDGFAFLQALKANPALKKIPVIILSNLNGAETIARAKGLGAEDYFVKANTDLKILAEKVKKIISSHATTTMA